MSGILNQVGSTFVAGGSYIVEHAQDLYNNKFVPADKSTKIAVITAVAVAILVIFIYLISYFQGPCKKHSKQDYNYNHYPQYQYNYPPQPQPKPMPAPTPVTPTKTAPYPPGFYRYSDLRNVNKTVNELTINGFIPSDLDIQGISNLQSSSLKKLSIPGYVSKYVSLLPYLPASLEYLEIKGGDVMDFAALRTYLDSKSAKNLKFLKLSNFKENVVIFDPEWKARDGLTIQVTPESE